MPAISSHARLVDLAPAQDSFRTAVLDGLGARPKAIPAKYFYDARGAQLFEAICELPEYYLTRTEVALFTRDGDEMARRIGKRAEIVEYGSGGGHKVRLLLDALDDPVAYLSVDLSADHMRAAAEILAADYPGLDVTAVIADYSRPFALPRPRRKALARCGLFTGSSIGNFTPEESVVFLAGASRLLERGGMLVGVDLKKDARKLHAAYNDDAGVTAEFNLNLLERINRELGGEFERARFAHRAFYDPDLGRIEMHLESLVAQSVRVAGERFEFVAGETIHTENSYKYGVEEFQALARRAGFVPETVWIDDQRLFAIHFLRVA